MATRKGFKRLANLRPLESVPEASSVVFVAFLNQNLNRWNRTVSLMTHLTKWGNLGSWGG